MLDNLENKINEILESRVNECLEIVKQEIDKNTPENTKKLLWKNKIEKAKLVWNEIIWKVVNITKYVLYVEKWVWKVFRYNKPKWTIFYKWDWVHMFAKWFDFSQERIKKILSKSLIWTSLKFQK